MFYSVCPQTFWGLGLRSRRVVSQLQQTMWDVKELKRLSELASNKKADLKLKSYQKWSAQCMFVAPSTICCAVSVASAIVSISFCQFHILLQISVQHHMWVLTFRLAICSYLGYLA